MNFSEELDDEAVDVTVFGQASGNNTPHAYANVDTIHMETF